MAVDTFPLHEAQTVLAVKEETTTGTAESLAAADGVLNVYGAELTDETENTEREGQGSASHIPSIPGGHRGRLRFETDLVTDGSGAFPAVFQRLLKSCGMTVATNTVATFVTGATSATTNTFGFYEDGVVRTLFGAMGTWTITLRSGQAARWAFDFLGIIGTDADASILAPTYPTVLPARFAGGAVTLDSYTIRSSEIVIAANNAVELREDGNNNAGYRSAYIGRRSPTVTLDPEATLLATKNWQTLYRASTEAALSIATSATANKIFTFAAPKAQVMKHTRGKRNGFLTNQLELQLNRSTSAGDDELSITSS